MTTKIQLCKHNTYCNVRKGNGRGNCFAMEEPITCKIYKFYDKYGLDWNNLGIGAMSPQDVNKLEKKSVITPDDIDYFG